MGVVPQPADASTVMSLLPASMWRRQAARVPRPTSIATHGSALHHHARIRRAVLALPKVKPAIKRPGPAKSSTPLNALRAALSGQAPSLQKRWPNRMSYVAQQASRS